jgi:mRNA interferase YafQ
MLIPVHTKRFRKDIDLARKRGKDLEKLKEVVTYLVEEQPLPNKYRDHSLTGNYINRRECHIEPDWLLIYKPDGQEIIFERTGSHSELFK